MIVDGVTCNVLIGKEKKSWDEGRNAIKEVYVYFRYIYGVTGANIVLEDASNSVGAAFDLTEGQLITLIYGKDGTNSHEFRIAKVTRSSSNNTNFYTLVCYMNEITWFLDGSTSAYVGNSSDAISAIAAECGLEAEVDVTSDSRTWYGSGRRNYVTARAIAQKGYIDDKSLMAVAFMPGKIIYKDLNRIDTDNPVAFFKLGVARKGNTFPIISVKLMDKAGVMNLREGYKILYDQNSIEGADTRKNIEAINVANRTGNVSHRAEIASQISVPKPKFSGARTDNDHGNQGNAEYQNVRGMSVLSNSGIAILTQDMTNLDIFAPIWVQLSQTNAGATGASENRNVANDGPYIMMSRIVRIAGNSYSEKIIAYREGTII